MPSGTRCYVPSTFALSNDQVLGGLTNYCALS
jgi:hypothetical protein